MQKRKLVAAVYIGVVFNDKCHATEKAPVYVHSFIHYGMLSER